MGSGKTCFQLCFTAKSLQNVHSLDKMKLATSCWKLFHVLDPVPGLGLCRGCSWLEPWRHRVPLPIPQASIYFCPPAPLLRPLYVVRPHLLMSRERPPFPRPGAPSWSTNQVKLLPSLKQTKLNQNTPAGREAACHQPGTWARALRPHPVSLCSCILRSDLWSLSKHRSLLSTSALLSAWPGPALTRRPGEPCARLSGTSPLRWTTGFPTCLGADRSFPQTTHVCAPCWALKGPYARARGLNTSIKICPFSDRPALILMVGSASYQRDEMGKVCNTKPASSSTDWEQ